MPQWFLWPPHPILRNSIWSRLVWRQPAVAGIHWQALQGVWNGFRQVTVQRKALRSHRKSLSLVDRFMSMQSNGNGNGNGRVNGSGNGSGSGTSGDGSDGSSESANREDMRGVLDAALGSLNVMRNMYEQREARWAEEMKRMSEDRKRVELLLRQVLGDQPTVKTPTTANASVGAESTRSENL